MKYGFNEKTLELIIRILKQNDSHDLEQKVRSIFNVSKDRIIPPSKRNTFNTNRMLASMTKCGYLCFWNSGKNYINILIDDMEIGRPSYQIVPIYENEYYIMKQMINTRYNRLKGVA